MKRSILVLTILTALGTAYASPGDDGCVGNCSPNGGGSGDSSSNPIDIANTNRNSNTNTNFAGALSGSQSKARSNANSNSKSLGVGIGVGGDTRSNAVSSGGDASSTTTVNVNEAESMRYSGSYDVKTVGVAVAPDIQATSGCRKPLSLSGGWLGGAIGFGTTFLDETCVRGELIRFGLTSSDPKTQQMTNDLLQYDLAKELEIARKAEAKEAKKNVNAYQTPPASNTADNTLWFTELGG